MDKRTKFEKEYGEKLKKAELYTTGMGEEEGSPLFYANDIIDFHESTFNDIIYILRNKKVKNPSCIAEYSYNTAIAKCIKEIENYIN